jgi:hypothetical protein
MLIYAGMFRTTVRQVSAGSRVQDLGREHTARSENRTPQPLNLHRDNLSARPSAARWRQKRQINLLEKLLIFSATPRFLQRKD